MIHLLKIIKNVQKNFNKDNLHYLLIKKEFRRKILQDQIN